MSTVDGAGWANQQLIEFLAALSGGEDETAILPAAVEQAVDAVEGEVGALVAGGEVVASIGFPRGRVPVQTLVELGAAASSTAAIPGFGECCVTSVVVGVLPEARLVVARPAEAFSREEVALLRAMSRVVELVVLNVRNLATERTLRERSEQQAEENRRLIASLRERQDLLERLGAIQRLIASREPLQDIFDAVLGATVDLLGVEIAGMRLIDSTDPEMMELVAWRGISADLLPSMRWSPASAGIGAQAIREGRLVVTEDYRAAPNRLQPLARSGVLAAMAAPMVGPDGPLGSIAVATHDPGRTFSARDQEILLSLAEHAKLALNDAGTVGALEHALAVATHRASHDDLTGLPNRVLFLDRLEHALQLARRSASTLAVLFVDIDEFKLVNDTLGHELGDVLLQGVAERLGAAVRSSDTAARLGGDEFALLLENVEVGDVLACAERVLSVLREPLVVGGQRVLTRASIGISLSSAGDHEASSLLREADVAMYQAKAQGKDCFVIFESAMQERVQQRMDVEMGLHRAVERGEFVLWYQSVVSLATERVTGVEALVRWQHPERGLVPPASFIALAEETGLMVPLGAWILHEACRQAAVWRGASSDLLLSVNISPRQLRDEGLVDVVRSALAASGLPPAALKLELTESALIADTEAMLHRLDDLKALGVALAIDDFGTGYSSLGYLRRFPVDELKIDKAFVDDLLDDGARSSLAEVVVALATTLGMRTVAEGVETAQQARMLALMGCAEAQGFHFHRPMPADAATRVLTHERAWDPALA